MAAALLNYQAFGLPRYKRNASGTHGAIGFKATSGLATELASSIKYSDRSWMKRRNRDWKLPEFESWIFLIALREI